jgi:hypothetical protein
MEKAKTPTLPKEVAELYECCIVPTTVVVTNPPQIAGRYDLQTISLADAEKLANSGKYLKKKGQK